MGKAKKIESPTDTTEETVVGEGSENETAQAPTATRKERIAYGKKGGLAIRPENQAIEAKLLDEKRGLEKDMEDTMSLLIDENDEDKRQAIDEKREEIQADLNRVNDKLRKIYLGEGKSK